MAELVEPHPIRRRCSECGGRLVGRRMPSGEFQTWHRDKPCFRAVNEAEGDRLTL